MRIFILAFTCIVFFASTLGVAMQIHASMGSVSGEYVIFRANIPPMFIMNSSSPIQVLAIPFKDNKPIYATIAVHISIQGLNVKYHYNNTVNVRSGESHIIYVDPMRQGHYEITLYAEYKGIKSRVVEQDFAVSPAPDPYELYFTQDGSEIHFTSKVLNETGDIDPNVTFHIEIYAWDGSKEELVATYDGVTNITIPVQESWKGGILIVNVIDRYGWVNGMSINLAQMQFQGVPVQYDYHYAEREPFASRQIWYLVFALVAILWLGYHIRGWYVGGKK